MKTETYRLYSGDFCQNWSL